MSKALEQLKDIVKIQTMDGNWNYDPYMHGMANGLIYSLDLIKGKNNPKFLDAPDKWLNDKANKTAFEILNS